MSRALLLLLLSAAACRAPAASASSPDASASSPDASASSPDASASHVCYGAAGSAVEVPRSTPCEALGASESPPATVPPPPPPRRTRVAVDAGILF